MFEKVVLNTLEIMLIILTFMMIYRMGISLFGFGKIKREYEIRDDKLSFLFLIPACNEENVILDALSSLKNLDYSKHLYDAVVLVNNSTDRTYEISQKSGFKTFDIKFGPNEAKGKPHVLRKFFSKSNLWKDYDYVVILDADNVVSNKFLKEMNSQILCRRENDEDITVVQGYLGAKNIFTSLMSCGYSGSYFISNRAYQYAKHKLGLNTSIGGTGFALKKEYILENGWNPKSYTEDFELQIELSMNGKKSIWNHFAVIYDEKPVTLRASHRQRTRWAQGHWYIALSTTFKQVISIFNLTQIKSVFTKFESLVYSYSMLRPVVWLFLALTAIFIDLPENFKLKLFSFMLIWLLFGLYEYIVLPISMLRYESKYLFKDDELTVLDKIKRALMLYIGIFYSGITYMIPQIIGFFTWFLPQNNWEKTEHLFGIEYSNIEKEIALKEDTVNRELA